MNEFMSLAVVAFKYLAALVITLMAFKAAYERSKGGDLKSLIVGFLTFIGVFWCFIVLFPVLFNIGFSRVYTQVESSPHVDNLTKLAGAGVQLVMANPQSVSLEVPAVGSVTEEVSAALNLPAITTGNAASPLYGEPAAVKVAPTMPAARLANDPGSVPINSNADAIGAIQAIAPTAVPVVPTAVPVQAMTPSAEYLELKRQQGETPNAGGGMDYINKFLEEQKAAQNDGGPGTYTVQRGDSMGKIAEKFGVSVSDLCNANISVTRNNCNVIRAGWVLAIP